MQKLKLLSFYLRTQNVPNNVLEGFFTDIITFHSSTTLCDRYYFTANYMDEETEAQRV